MAKRRWMKPDAIAALVSDLHWQIDQLRPRGIKDSAGNPYNPSYYKRGLQNAINRGGLAVAEYIRRYSYKPPSGGYKKLEEADSLDLACEALVADESKPHSTYSRTATVPPRGRGWLRTSRPSRRERRRLSHASTHDAVSWLRVSNNYDSSSPKPPSPRTRSRSTWRS
jgi:hypothetical protein